MNVNSITGLRISLASPEQIRQWSHGEVTKPDTLQLSHQQTGEGRTLLRTDLWSHAGLDVRLSKVPPQALTWLCLRDMWSGSGTKPGTSRADGTH